MAKTYKSERYAIPFTHDQIARRQREARILSRIVKALREAGNPVVSLWDGEESSPVDSVGDVVHLAYNLDEFHLYTKSGGWVYFIMGNQWDGICDYTVSLEEALKPVHEWIEKQERKYS